MRRYIIYLPDVGDWVKVLIGLEGLGRPQTDQKHIVALATETDPLEVQNTLARSVKYYIMTEVTGEVGANVGSDHVAIVSALQP